MTIQPRYIQNIITLNAAGLKVSAVPCKTWGYNKIVILVYLTYIDKYTFYFSILRIDTIQSFKKYIMFSIIYCSVAGC